MRVPVPEDAYTINDRITVAGYNDHLYGEADVNLPDRANGPLGLRVDRDEDGLYVGVYHGYAPEVARYLNEEHDAGLDPAEYGGDEPDPEEPDSNPADAPAEESDADEGDGPSGDEDDEDEYDDVDVPSLRDEHWQTVANRVERGDLDNHLDALAEHDDRNSVQEAIEDRRETLED